MNWGAVFGVGLVLAALFSVVISPVWILVTAGVGAIWIVVGYFGLIALEMGALA